MQYKVDKKMITKIHIFGGPGSGKSYLASKLETVLGINTTNLDDLFWDNTQSTFNTIQDTDIRNQKLRMILSCDSWIIEGVYYDWLSQSFINSEIIIIINTSSLLRALRILKRFILRKLKIKKSNKKETFRGLYNLLIWNRKFNSDNYKLALKMIEPYENKTFIFNSADKALQYLSKDVADCL